MRTYSQLCVSAGNSSSIIAASHSRPRARNDGTSPRKSAYNVDFGIDSSAFILPSTGGVQNMNVEGMGRRFADIVLSINDLARQGLVRAVHVINDDIID